MEHDFQIPEQSSRINSDRNLKIELPDQPTIKAPIEKRTKATTRNAAEQSQHLKDELHVSELQRARSAGHIRRQKTQSRGLPQIEGYGA